MALQMIARHAVPDYAAWKVAFDEGEEARRDAGLSLLQLWRGTEDRQLVCVLFRVNDASRAKAFASEVAARLESSGLATASSFELVETQ